MGHEFEGLSSRILAAAVDVHKALGPGWSRFIKGRWKSHLSIAELRFSVNAR